VSELVGLFSDSENAELALTGEVSRHQCRRHHPSQAAHFGPWLIQVIRWVLNGVTNVPARTAASAMSGSTPGRR
jgi:hypothetical protein